MSVFKLLRRWGLNSEFRVFLVAQGGIVGALRQGKLFKVRALQGDVKSFGLSPLEQAEEAHLLSDLTAVLKTSSVLW